MPSLISREHAEELQRAYRREQSLHKQVERLERCLYECIEEGGVGVGWEIEMIHETARPTNDPSEE